MRIIVMIEESRVDDAAIVLETLGFVADDAKPREPPKEGVVKIAGDFPEKELGELQAVAGVIDWFIPPIEEEKPERAWPWSQMPETD